MNNCVRMDFEGQRNPNSAKNKMSLKKLKEQLYRQNSNYLCRHPELRAIIRVLLHELLSKQPENIYEFSAALFNCNNSPLLVTKINQQLKLMNSNPEESRWNEFEAEMFSDTGGTHSQ